MAAGRVASFSLLAGVAGLAALAAACSGAGNEDLFETGLTNETSSNEPAPATSASGSAGKTSPTQPGTPGSEPTPLPPGTPPTTPPAEGVCTPELEPNNDIAKATPFTSSLCGKIDSLSDVDYGRIVVPMTATTMTFTHAEKNGRVSYRFFFGNIPVQADANQLEVVPGATYNVQMRLTPNTGNDRPTYELAVSFK
jgi:hypothetical protein